MYLDISVSLYISPEPVEIIVIFVKMGHSNRCGSSWQTQIMPQRSEVTFLRRNFGSYRTRVAVKTEIASTLSLLIGMESSSRLLLSPNSLFNFYFLQIHFLTSTRLPSS